jgi:hypothetical protein
MPLFEISGEELQEHPPAQFADLGLYERGDLQRLLRDRVGVLADDLLVVAEEFGDWEDARRRIDLLAIDTEGHPTVIELKRTEDGGHMELQSLRYAAMVSSMSFEDFASALAAYRSRRQLADEVDARSHLATFLGCADGEEPMISSEVRIILVSANFGRDRCVLTCSCRTLRLKARWIRPRPWQLSVPAGENRPSLRFPQTVRFQGAPARHPRSAVPDRPPTYLLLGNHC